MNLNYSRVCVQVFPPLAERFHGELLSDRCELMQERCFIQHLEQEQPDVTGFRSWETTCSGKVHLACQSLYVFVCGWGRKWWVGYLLYTQLRVLTNSSVSFLVAQNIYFSQWLKWWVQTGPLPTNTSPSHHWPPQRVLSVEYSRPVRRREGNKSPTSNQEGLCEFLRNKRDAVLASDLHTSSMILSHSLKVFCLLSSCSLHVQRCSALKDKTNI